MKYGYARVSTIGQSLTAQTIQLKAADCDKIYAEKYTGTTIERPKFQLLLKTLRPGDTLVVTKLDRFARNTMGALEITKTLFQNSIKVTILNIGTIADTPTGELDVNDVKCFRTV